VIFTVPASAQQPRPAPSGKINDAFQTLRDADKRQAKSRGVHVGMTKAEALGSNWGAPRKVNTTITAAGTHEQWVYHGSNYLYFDNGSLSSIQTGP
jgi:hypothetical protein